MTVNHGARAASAETVPALNPELGGTPARRPRRGRTPRAGARPRHAHSSARASPASARSARGARRRRPARPAPRGHDRSVAFHSLAQRDGVAVKVSTVMRALPLQPGCTGHGAVRPHRREWRHLLDPQQCRRISRRGERANCVGDRPASVARDPPRDLPPVLCGAPKPRRSTGDRVRDLAGSGVREPITDCATLSTRAPVAQWTEHLTSDQTVGGSNPSGRARFHARTGHLFDAGDVGVEPTGTLSGTLSL